MKLNSVELTTITYIAITTVMIAIYGTQLDNLYSMLLLRAAALIIIPITYFLSRSLSTRWALCLRTFPLMALLVFWYPETYDFCSMLPYQDHVFAAIDQQLFGCQPSLEFAQVMPQTFWSEAFNMGYYAYYYMMAAVIIFYLVCRTTHYDRATFIFLGSFFIFYLVFEFLPVAGPQYYFQALHDIYGTDPFTSLPWPLPSVGHYFSTHQAAMLPEAKGIFSQLVLGAQEMGEHPTAAFPSSHVGMSTVVMLLAWRSGNRTLPYILLPFYILLCMATVYIRAHYLIDSICGLIFAVVLYLATDRLYTRLHTHANP